MFERRSERGRDRGASRRMEPRAGGASWLMVTAVVQLSIPGTRGRWRRRVGERRACSAESGRAGAELAEPVAGRPGARCSWEAATGEPVLSGSGNELLLRETRSCVGLGYNNTESTRGSLVPRSGTAYSGNGWYMTKLKQSSLQMTFPGFGNRSASNNDVAAVYVAFVTSL